MVREFHPRLYVAVLLPEGGVGDPRHAARGSSRDARVFTLDTGVLFPETYETWRARRGALRHRAIDGRSTRRRGTATGCGSATRTLLRHAQGRAARARARRRRRVDHRPAPRPVADARRHAEARAGTSRTACGSATRSPTGPRSDVWRYIAEHDVPYNPLHDRGYASIGCTHCTAARRGPRRAAGPAPTRPSAACTLAGGLMDPLVVLFGLGVGVLVGADRHRRRLADDAAADPLHRRQAGGRGRHRPRLRRDHQDGRRLAPPAHGHGRHRRLAKWLAVGSCPGALGGVYVLDRAARRLRRRASTTC